MKKIIILFMMMLSIVSYSQVANTPADLELCDDDYDGFTQFYLESQTAVVLGEQDPTQFTVSYHISLVDAETNSNTLISPYTNSTVGLETIFVRVTNTITSCFTIGNFSLIVNNCAPTFNWSSDDYYNTSIGNQGISKTIDNLTIQVYHTNSNADLIVENGYILTNYDNSSNEIVVEYSNQVNLKSTLLSSKDGSNVYVTIEHFREDDTFIVRQTSSGIDEDYILLTNYNEIKKSEFDFEQNNWKIGEIIINSYTLSTQDISPINIGLPYPNPTTSIVALNSSKDYNIGIFDMAGNKVMETTGNTIDLSILSSAMYIVKAFDKATKETESYKVVKN